MQQRPQAPKTRPVPIAERTSLARFIAGRYKGRVIEAPDSKGEYIRRNQKIVRLTFEKDIDLQKFISEPVVVKGVQRGENKKLRPITIEGAKVIKICACSSNRTVLCLIEATNLTDVDNAGGLVIEPGDGNPPPRVSGADNTILFNDLVFGTTDPAGSSELTSDRLAIIARRARELGNVPTVAVIDTGFDYNHIDTITLSYSSGTSTCTSGTITNDYIGWNFVDGNNNPYDDGPSKHGTQVAAMISHRVHGRVKIMPIKVFGSDGYGEVFDLLCALEYLKTKPAVKIINGSFGYYAKKGSKLLQSLIGEMDDKLFVSAAGNRNDFINAPRPRDITGFPSEGNTIQFFPACFSNTVRNMITVTSVANVPAPPLNAMIAVENFSTQFVDLGVRTNQNGEFISHLPEITSPVIGSSYATAQVSGAATSLLSGAALNGNQLRDAVYGLSNTNPFLEAKYVEKGRFI
jgi:subtilisin family serine protease